MPIPVGTTVLWEVRNPLGPCYQDILCEGKVMDSAAIADDSRQSWTVRHYAKRALAHPTNVLVNKGVRAIPHHDEVMVCFEKYLTY
jgi:hypothetical protein